MDKAYSDMSQIYNYISKDFLYYAEKTIISIFSYIKDLETSPYIGHLIQQISNNNFRELIYKSYRIIYSFSKNQDKIFIEAIIHTSRNLNQLI